MCRAKGWLVSVLLLAFAAPAHAGGLLFIQAYVDGVGGVDGIHGVSGVALSPDGAHVYATGRTEDAVAVFSRNAGTGTLTPVEVQRDGVGGVDGLALATGVAVSPDGAHVYVSAELDDAIAAFSRNGGTGALTFVAVVKDGIGGVDGLKSASAVAVSPDGAHVYATGLDDDALAVFSRNVGTGVLTFVEVHKDGVAGVGGLRRPRAVTLSPDGAHVYVAGEGSDSVAVFSRNVGTGALTFVEFQQDGVGGVNGLRRPHGITVSGDGANVYVPGTDDNSLAVFSRNAGTGALTFLEFIHGDSEIKGLKGASAAVVDVSGAFVYVTASTGHDVSVLRRTAPLAPLQYLETQFNGLAGVSGLQGATAIAASSDGAHIYAAGRQSNALAAFAIDTCGNGALGSDEECDDGGVVSGDGCSSTCRLEVCPPSPSGVGICRTSESAKSKLTIRDYSSNRKDRVDFQFAHGQMTSLAEFGDPTTTTSYVACVYDGSGGAQPLMSPAAPAGGICRDDPCWVAKTGRYEYKDKYRTPDGIEKLQTRAGDEDGKTQIKLLGKGSNLSLPPGLPFVAPLIIEVRNNQTGVCWQATFSTFFVTPSGTGVRLSARSD